jgi:hypothetical protein
VLFGTLVNLFPALRYQVAALRVKHDFHQEGPRSGWSYLTVIHGERASMRTRNDPVAEDIRRLGLEQHHGVTLKQMRAHLARDETEFEAAQCFVDPGRTEETEMDLVRVVAIAA